MVNRIPKEFQPAGGLWHWVQHNWLGSVSDVGFTSPSRSDFYVFTCRLLSSVLVYSIPYGGPSAMVWGVSSRRLLDYYHF